MGPPGNYASAESSQALAVSAIGLAPVLDLGISPGREHTGAAMTVFALGCAVGIYNKMASFASARGTRSKKAVCSASVLPVPLLQFFRIGLGGSHNLHGAAEHVEQAAAYVLVFQVQEFLVYGLVVSPPAGLLTSETPGT